MLVGEVHLCAQYGTFARRWNDNKDLSIYHIVVTTCISSSKLTKRNVGGLCYQYPIIKLSVDATRGSNTIMAVAETLRKSSIESKDS